MSTHRHDALWYAAGVLVHVLVHVLGDERRQVWCLCGGGCLGSVTLSHAARGKRRKARERGHAPSSPCSAQHSAQTPRRQAPAGLARSKACDGAREGRHMCTRQSAVYPSALNPYCCLSVVCARAGYQTLCEERGADERRSQMRTAPSSYAPMTSVVYVLMCPHTPMCCQHMCVSCVMC